MKAMPVGGSPPNAKRRYNYFDRDTDFTPFSIEV
jgi:hypothetical protein